MIFRDCRADTQSRFARNEQVLAPFGRNDVFLTFDTSGTFDTFEGEDAFSAYTFLFDTFSQAWYDNLTLFDHACENCMV